MNIWDSVHRGLEKASHEAGRIARTQRLRSTADRLARQINEQEGSLLGKTMELFTNGALIQNELAPICQELINLHQQLTQAQAELQQLNNQAPNPQAATGPQEIQNTYPPQLPMGTYPPPGESAPTVYAPPPPPGFQPYIDRTEPIPVPPPPPGVEPLTISARETILMPGNTPPPPPGFESEQKCSQCGTTALEGNLFCHNCGTPLRPGEASHQPTVRAGMSSSPDQVGQATVRASDTSELEYDETVRAERYAPDANAGPALSPEKDGGN